MKKHSFILKIILLLMVTALILAACTGNGVVPKDSGNALTPPSLIGSGDTVSWNKVEGADEYEIFVNGKKTSVTEGTYYIYDGNGSAEIYVVAKSNGKKDSPRSNIVKCEGNSTVQNKEVFLNYILDDGSWDYVGDIDESIRFVQKNQSEDESLWRTFERVFAEHLDDDNGYRGEFWGKTMRGAVMAYQYTGDEKLYEIIKTSVLNVMACQDEYGRISGFSIEKEFGGWDIWGRHYVMVGLLRFYSICKDADLKDDIVECCKKQMDYIIEHVGDGSDERLNILDTSSDWQGLPSTRVIQSALSIYCLTQDEKYLDYAAEIISTGGTKMRSDNGNTIIEDCLAKTPIYEWGCRKFYELTNFFDGILMYYMLTGDERSKQISLNYFDLVSATEITETGAIATDVEEVNNASVEQADPSNLGRMQENCAVVSWIKYCAKIYMVFDNLDAIEYIEKAYYNILLASVDYDMHSGLPMFSYSPCACNVRSNIYSGGAYVGDRFYSCCVASSIAALGLVPQMSVTSFEKGISLNMYFEGDVDCVTPSGQKMALICKSELPVGEKVSVRLNIENSETFTIRVRIPSWSENTVLKVNGQVLPGAESGKYREITSEWENGDLIEIETDMEVRLIHGSEECSNPDAVYNVAVERGPVAFARDYRIEGDAMFSPVDFVSENDVIEDAEIVKVDFKHQIALRIKTADGYVTLVDYGSAGKTMSDESIMCLWIPTRDYWSVDMSGDIVVRAFADGSPNYWKGDYLYTAQSYGDSTDKEVLSNFAWRFVPVSGKENVYRILDVNSGKYVTVDENGYSLTRKSDIIDDGTQYFSLKVVGLNRYKIKGFNGKLITVHDGTLETYMFDDIGHDLQYWYFEEIN